MTASLAGVYNLQAFTSAGDLADSYRLYTYAPGTTTHKDAYTTAAANVAHTYTSDGSGGQFIALDSRGEIPAPLFLTTGGYDLCLKTSAGSTVWTRRAYGTEENTSSLTTLIDAKLSKTRAIFTAISSASRTTGTGECSTYTEVVDIGGDFNNTTGRFTAPVAGTYWFAWSVQANTDAASGVAGFLRVNGNTPNRGSASVYNDVVTGDAAQGNATAGCAMALTLAQGDYVSVWTTVTGGVATVVDVFSGHFLG